MILISILILLYHDDVRMTFASWNLILHCLHVWLGSSGFTRRLTSVTFDTKRPQVRGFIIATELQRYSVVKLAVMQIHYTATHAAMATISDIYPALESYPCTSAYSSILAIHWLNTSGINGL